MLKKVLFVVFVFIKTLLFSQEMQEGFLFLETGKYHKAIGFFENILKEYPHNKTAQLCYARAVGLSGNSEKAVELFNTLKTQYPSDFEIELNYAESLLWDKQFALAEDLYTYLVEKKPSSFPAVLGYANTLSNLKKYPQALNFVEKALVLDKGNENALNSLKYIRLGYAHQLSKNKEYDKALLLLNDNLSDYPNDKDTQLNKANIYLMTNDLINAEKAYKSIATSATDSISSLNGLSLIAHKALKNKKALQISTQARTKVTNYQSNKSLYLATHERYIQALLWNRKFKKASSELSELSKIYPNNAKVQSLEATYGLYVGDFKKSIEKYETILTKKPNSFDGNLGIANAYRANGNDLKSYHYIFQTLGYYNKQTDAETLLKALKLTHTPWITQKTVFTFDNGNNNSLSTEVAAIVPLSTKTKASANYTFRSTENTVTGVRAITDQLSLGLSHKFSGKLSVASQLGVVSSNAITQNFSVLTAEIKVKTKPFTLQNLDFGYQRQLQNFNADLIDREIVMNNYYVNYSLNTTFKLGFYGQYVLTNQTDGNIRNLVFTSLYYTVFNNPTVKLGANYQTLTFKDQVPTIYFSPSKFHVFELFADLINTHQGNWLYAASVAAGYQFIEDNSAADTFRIEGKVGYKFSDRFSVKAYAKHSNIASDTAIGFQFTEVGLLLKWYFLRHPTFNKKIKALNTFKK